MLLKRLERLGNWNPQLVRELKGRLKPRNLAIALTLSLVGQLLIVMTCFMSFNGNVVIDWPLLWSEVFVRLSWFSTLALLGVGTYLLINDLAQEERRGTLNFLRLSPQSTQTILLGKLLGVPSLLYLALVLAVPLHLGSGLAAQIPLNLILGFYGVFVANCLFVYSAALLYGLTCTWLGGFQAWLGSGMVLAFFLSIKGPASGHGGWIIGYWGFLFSPLAILPYLVPSTTKSSYPSIPNINLENWKWFSLPLGVSDVSFIAFLLLNYGLCSYFLWRSLKRCFRDKNATLLSKRQSYLFIAWFQLLTVGSIRGHFYLAEDTIKQIFTNLWLFLWLIAAVSPHRTALQDWVRHRRDGLATRQHFWNQSLMQDLIWGEKSPALVAIFLNLVITVAIMTRIYLIPRPNLGSPGDMLVGSIFDAVLDGEVILSLNVILVYAAVAQRILLMRTQRRGLWAVSTVAFLIVLSQFISRLRFSASGEASSMWSLVRVSELFSPLPMLSVESAITFFLALLGQWSIVGFLSWQLMRQLRRVGESDDKALLTEQ
jgi:hypothetical protein